ncbi:arabinosyltransferase-like protein [Selaginella moellendorffii]|uniref:Arabinosyltransferase-like protein n=2 Tax=Selaginella moellendorffii TaxID=88036 RepID=D8S870_SELML|nr:arabinosyltransferase-like protein [Selaginella moellendorffii]
MRRGSIWAPTLLLLLAYLVLHGASNVFFFESRAVVQSIGPAARHLKSSESLIALPVSESRPLRIFMHDLPSKFTYGVVERYLRSRGIARNDKRLRYPGTQHSAEWWLFYDLEQGEDRRLSDSSVRVMNPQEADVFYVPFFSSLSLVVGNGKSEDDEDPYSDEDTQEELMAWLEEQESWKKNKGRDHVVICQDPNALKRLRDRLKNTVLLLSDFERFKPDQASLVKDVVLPYTHRIDSYSNENVTLDRDTLLFFMGNRYRKEGGKIRDQLFQVLDVEPDMVMKHGTQSREGRRLAKVGMQTSKFCLHPAGDTPSACRLFDAIVSVCVPVIVSDDIELPFEDELDYSEFAIFVPSINALEPGYLGSYLRSISPDLLKQKQQRLREVRKYFEYEEKGGAVEMIWLQVKKKLPFIRTMINRDKRLVERSSGNCSCICS